MASPDNPAYPQESTWWLRLRFMEGYWVIVDQTQDRDVVEKWDEEIDAKEERTRIDHEWIVHMPYGARPVGEAPSNG
ncbi:MAG: hypothetical protein J2P58_10295 [Acidimicrobiaceae bacterium]|nr:hypothetical protein [Acidimicrobiaceae bacterium]